MDKILDNYKRIKKLQYFAKQTFLDEQGKEIIPTLENLEVFRKELKIIIDMVDELGHDIHRKSKD